MFPRGVRGTGRHGELLSLIEFFVISTNGQLETDLYVFCVQGGYLRRLVTGVTPNDPTLDRTPNDLNIAGDFDPTRKECVAACEYMTRLEQTPQTVLIGYLSRMHHQGFIRVIGPLTDDPNVRVPTFSFVPTTGGISVASVVAAAHSAKIAIRYVYFFCFRMGD